MDSDRAYLFGLIIGGGHFGNNANELRIRLPYKKWGSYLDNPRRAGEISGDILRKVGQMFRAIYSLTVQYETTPGGIWTILCEGDTSLVRTELQRYGMVCEGNIGENANLSSLVKDLVDDNLKRRFIAGLADTIGSMAKSQRRFTAEHQILSFEIKGYQFRSVCALCHLLYSINCIPDQINWNHPNIHCTNNPYYSEWHKGFKLRILLDQYAKFGAFAFRTKAESSQENRRLQQQSHYATKCEERQFNVLPSSVHPAENDIALPPEIRGGHFLHFRHFCAVMGCEHAPYRKIEECFSNLGYYIIPFPILCKETLSQINEIVNNDPILKARTYRNVVVSIKYLLDLGDSTPSALLYGDSEKSGYPIAEILQAIAYIIADQSELFGKRPRGSYTDIIKNHIQNDPGLQISIKCPDLLTPLVLIGNNRGALVGAVNPNVYASLVTRDPANKYKLLVRKISEKDLK